MLTPNESPLLASAHLGVAISLVAPVHFSVTTSSYAFTPATLIHLLGDGVWFISTSSMEGSSPLALATKSVILRDVNWLGDEALEALGDDGFACFAKVRSTRPPKPAILHYSKGKVKVDLIYGEEGVASGQACVLYSSIDDDARVYGGGFIAKSERSADTERMLEELRDQSSSDEAIA